MAVNIDHVMRCASCTKCGATIELSRCRTGEALVINADLFQDRHICHAKKALPAQKPIDRWKSLFAGIEL